MLTAIQELDDGEDEIVRFVQRSDDLVCCHCDRIFTGLTAFHFNEPQLSRTGNTALNVITEMFGLPVDGLESEASVPLP